MRPSWIRKLGLIIALAGLLLPDPSAAQPRPSGARRVVTVDSAGIDAAGDLVIVTSDHRTILVPREGEQSSFDDPIVSSARTAVGAQAEFPNCCTSYDIPLQLVVYALGKVHRFTGIGLPIFRWHFADGGTRVAFAQETVHFSCSTHYELRDIKSEQLIASADIPEPCGQAPVARVVKMPKWVADLNAGPKS